MLLEAWKSFETKKGSKDTLKQILDKMPKRVKKQKKIKVMNDGVEEDAGWEEYYDYIFPDDDSSVQNMKILQAA